MEKILGQALKKELEMRGLYLTKIVKALSKSQSQAPTPISPSKNVDKK